MKKFILLFFVVILTQSCVTISTITDVNTNSSRYLSLDGIYKAEEATFNAKKVIRRNNNQIVLDFSKLQGEVYYFLKTNQDIDLLVNYEVKQKDGLLDFTITDDTGKELTQVGSASQGRLKNSEEIHLLSYKRYKINFKGEDFKGKITVSLDQ